MRLPLKDFQLENVADLYRRFRLAYGEVKQGGDKQVLVLSSPTGSGKTLMVTALLEQIVQGAGDYAPLTDVAFLWLSDQPELNEQSRKKIFATSDAFKEMSKLVTIDNTFNQPTFDAGKIYFLNIQKLGKEKGLVTKGDDRSYTIWETMNNTIQENRCGLVLVIDEAHKGMLQRKDDIEAAATIVQKFIKGSPGEIPGIPLIIGISATTERFTELLRGVPGIVARSVAVNVQDVRESGLIKDKVIVIRPEKSDAADWTFLREAAQSWAEYYKQWDTYSKQQDLPVPVQPALVVQVEDGSGKRLSATDLARVIKTIRDVAGELPEGAFAHCFQEKQSLDIDGTKVPWVAPSNIQDDPGIQVVLFKVSLNTGWDCPRAEIMMSFRKALDYTSIAQLIGRMVRTPLARRVQSDEMLNAVRLFLPNYDKAAVQKVVDSLTKPGDERIASDVEVSAKPPAQLARATGSEKAFKLLNGLPYYRVHRLMKMSNVKRLIALGRYLAEDELDLNASVAAKKLVISELNARRKELSAQPDFEAQVAGLEDVELTGLAIEIGGSVMGIESRKVKLEEANLDDLFAAAGRKLGEGLHLAYVKDRVDTGVDVSLAKRELLALIGRPELIDRLEAAAQQKLTKWMNQFQPAIAELPDASRANYNRIRGTAKVVEPSPLNLPLSIEMPATGDDWPRHVYIDASTGNFKMAPTGWERAVLEVLLARKDIKWWLRNLPRKEWAFSLIYKDTEGIDTNMYPDFLVVRQEKTGLVVDIVEPHRTDEGDTARKLLGLAEYGARHGDGFGRILVIAKTDVFRSIDLNDEAARKAALAVTTTQSVVQLFSDYGVPVSKA